MNISPRLARRSLALRLSVALAAVACVLGSSFAAERSSSPYKVTTTPATAERGPIIKVETAGRVSNRYQPFDVADDTTFDLTGAHIGGSTDHPMQDPFRAGEQERPPKGIRIIGGVIEGGIPREWNWFLTHAFGGVGFYTVSTGVHLIDGARVHNMEDGWHPRETPSFKLRAYPNTGRFVLRNSYFTAIRDDCIENDEFLPGEVEDSLFDGVHCFLSEQNERQGGLYRPVVETIGPNEDRNINLTRVLVRLTVTNGGETGTGKWFKLLGRESPVHHINITDSVFATDAPPRQGGWQTQRIPKDATLHGTNYILWLGKPGGFGGEVPKGMTFLEGQAAKDKWHEVRNKWLVAHGYEPRSAEDLDPFNAPVAAPRRTGGKGGKK
jgi:hypothetical protein